MRSERAGSSRSDSWMATTEQRVARPRCGGGSHRVRLPFCGATAEADASIVAAAISVSRRLRLRVAAAGVETREPFGLLKTHGWQEGQGPYVRAAVEPERLAPLASTAART